MRIIMFYHSLVSDWNHGNAHFLRGISSELLARGHDVRIYAPANGWSIQNLQAEHGTEPILEFQKAYPGLNSIAYELHSLDLDGALSDADLVIVHEWNDHQLVRRIGEHRAAKGQYRLLFHDTHHRAITDPKAMAQYDLSHYDGVLAFGRVLRDLYLSRGWHRRAWTWHEAADTRIFRPIANRECEGDLVWIGNWGDDERADELAEFLLKPVRTLGLKARVYGVRYPEHALKALRSAGIEYGGWLANFHAPEVYARFKVTIHVPRRPYVRALPGIPTIRVFEALACGMPLVSAPWPDVEQLFVPQKDFLITWNGEEMTRHLERLVRDADARRQLGASGHRTIVSRHTCAHRVNELLAIVAELNTGSAPSQQLEQPCAAV
jgi:spore maturation protein CgeB